MKPLYANVAMDITSFCNLRCPFCLSQHDLPKVMMSRELFDKAVSLISLTRGNNFLLSCLYEPTLHPDFLQLIERIPRALRGKVFFTTNLAKKVPDEVFSGLAESGLHHINISLDSLDPATFEIFRRGAKFSRFHDNLERMVGIFQAAEQPPELFYISVVNRLNYREIPELMEQCFTSYLAAHHDIREYWLLTHQRELEWCIDQRLSGEELGQLKNSLASMPYRFSFGESGRDLGVLVPENNFRGEEVYDESRRNDDYYFNPYAEAGVRIQADGRVIVLGRNLSFQLQDIENPVSFFTDLHPFLEMDMAKSEELKKKAGMLIHSSLDVSAEPAVACSLDEVIYDPKTLKLCGWCFHRDGEKPRLKFGIPDGRELELSWVPLPSPDVEAVHGQVGANCRFEIRINLNYNFSPDDLLGATLSFSGSKEKKRFFRLPFFSAG